MLNKPILKVKYSYNELNRLIEFNDVDKLQEVLLINTDLLRKTEEFDIIKTAIKLNNLPALHLIIDIIENSNELSIEYAFSQQASLHSLLNLSIECSDCNIFIYIMNRFKISIRELSFQYINKIFEKNRFEIIQYLLTTTNFRYKMHSSYVMTKDTTYNDQFIYYNCENIDTSKLTSEDEEKYNIYNISSWIKNDKLKRIAYIKAWKYFVIKYKSGLGINFCPNQQKKVLKYI